MSAAQSLASRLAHPLCNGERKLRDCPVEHFLDTDELAARLNRAPKLIQWWRQHERGPRFWLCDEGTGPRRVIYHVDDVEQFLRTDQARVCGMFKSLEASGAMAS